MTDPALHLEVNNLILREGRLLDAQQWDDWLALYIDDAIFWAPAFRMDGTYTSDPATELNLVYLEGRRALEDRIFRIRTELGVSSMPMPRTSHLIGSVIIDRAAAHEVAAFASWQVAWTNEIRGQQIRAGSYEYVLLRTPEGLRIKRKKVLLLDPTIDGYIDVFAI